MTTRMRRKTLQPDEYCIDILSFRARVVGPPSVIDLVERLFPQGSSWRNPYQPARAYRIDVWQTGSDPEQWEVTDNEANVHTPVGISDLATLLAWVINTNAVETLATNFLLFHAGAVALQHVGIILPGRSGSGKSTLTAALVAQGCAYFSDEAAVISPTCGSILPFAKAIKLEPDSLPVLRSRYPTLAHDNDFSQRTTYLRPPDSSWPHAPVQPSFVVFPRYQAGAETRIESLSRSEGFARLMDHAFSRNNHGADGVRQVVRLLEGSTCHELTIGDLDDAVNLVLELAHTPR